VLQLNDKMNQNYPFDYYLDGWSETSGFSEPIQRMGEPKGRQVVSAPPDPRALRTPEREDYLSREELATLMGVHVKTIDRMVAKGMPSETWGIRTRKFRASVVLAWARAQGKMAP
jgi:excisionase family DNA binding protein